jgi:beta-glucanase (GH16 family)
MTHSKCTQWEGDNLWHTWRVWHDAETGNFQFYKDGRSYFTVRPSDLPNWCYGDHNPLYMILNMAVGGTGGGTPPASEFQAEMLIDWVVAYEGEI